MQTAPHPQTHVRTHTLHTHTTPCRAAVGGGTSSIVSFFFSSSFFSFLPAQSGASQQHECECEVSRAGCAGEQAERALALTLALAQAYAMLCNVCLHVGEPMEARLCGTMEEARESGSENAWAQKHFIAALFLALFLNAVHMVFSDLGLHLSLLFHTFGIEDRILVTPVL